MKDDRLVAMRVFLAVVDGGGFTAAARQLGVSQPFVSQSMQRLEERLGARLLHRTTRGHRLTTEGEDFVRGARRALAAIDEAEAGLAQSHASPGGHLRVSAPVAFGLDRVVPLLPAFLARHPAISLDLRLTDDSENLIDERIDVAIRMGRLPDSRLMHRRLCGLQRVVVAAPDLLRRHPAPRQPADLASMPCLAWDGAREHLNRWHFVVDGTPFVFRARSRFHSNDGMALYQMCLQGVGVMRLAEHLARPAIAEGRLVQLLADHTAEDDSAIYAVFLPDNRILPRLRVFIDHLAGAFRPEPW